MRLILSINMVFAFALAGRATAEELTYERDIRPIFKVHCFHCHGEEEELAGDLDLRLQHLTLKGGESGAGLVPGKPEKSLLLQRIRDGEMPPEDVAKRPTPEDVERITRWIAAGAKTARPEPEKISDGYITEEERQFWAFQPIQRPDVPEVSAVERIRTPIDRFILKKLEAKKLSLSADADKRALLRRAYFDLVGMPPSVEVTDAFLTDDRPNAYERLIDRLLTSPQYGERWGRHWLDVAGYADSEGYTDDDVERKDAYRFRDYVIRSLNGGKPFDEFVREQLAGDEMIATNYSELPPADVDKLVATGFLRMTPDGTGGSVDQGVARNQTIADTIQVVSTSLLGLTVGCAQCHNHRYDPISQADYYRMRAIFEPALDWKSWRSPSKRRISLYSDDDRKTAAKIEADAKKIEKDRLKKQEEYIQATFERELAKLPEELRKPIREAHETPDKKRTAEQKKLLKENPSVNVTSSSLYLYDRKAADDLKKYVAKAKKIRDSKPVESFVRALTEPANKKPPATYLFYRGDHEQPKQELAPAELTVLTSTATVEIPTADSQRPTTGRRLAYARWLTSGQHPLVARVIVNRVWLHHFGRGLVETPGDFGFLGARPSHPELLDWLADQFMKSGWDMKRLHKLIMTSTVYRQSSQTNHSAKSVDAENRLYWRMNLRRMEAEVLRDSMLAISGQLINNRFGPPVPVMADRTGLFVIGKENLNAGRPGPVIPMKGEDLRRSIYIQVRRSRPLAVMDSFDLPELAPNCTVRNSSTVAPQSLMLMNSGEVVKRAEQLALRCQKEASDLRSQVAYAWKAIFANDASEKELDEAVEFIDEQTAYFKSNPKKGIKPELEAFSSFCHALLSSNEFLYID